jgi:beta-glucosidase
VERGPARRRPRRRGHRVPAGGRHGRHLGYAPLIHEVADVIATEFRAKYVEKVGADGGSDKYRGLTVWSPNINIFRDPRWGRGQETYGEDPYLTSRLSVAFIHGLQGDDPKIFKTIATAKHFAVHSGPEAGRHRDDIHPSAYDLEDTYLPAFRATVIEGQAQAVMCAYNAVDGVPACANRPCWWKSCAAPGASRATWCRTAPPCPTSSAPTPTSM